MRIPQRLAAILVAPILYVTAQPSPVKDLLIPGVDPPYEPIHHGQRLTWIVRSTAGVQSLGVGILSAGIRTGLSEPPEYEGTWKGFGKRYGMRLTGVVTSNVMEAGAGVLWGEDPRYFRARSNTAFKGRVAHAIKMTFVAHSSSGALRPAYARHAANLGSSFLSNAWRTRSEASGQDALVRAVFGVLGRMGSNAFAEFWPDVKRRLSGNRPNRRNSGT